METKILKAVFGGGRYAVTTKRTRTDYGQVLEFVDVVLPDTFECIFSNSAASSGVGKKQIGSAQRVLIPDEYLATGQTIYAWILLHDSEDDGRHMYSIRIPVADMPDTSPEDPTPVEQSVISQAITALNSAVTTTSQKALEATESADRAEHAAEGTEGYAERAESAQQAAESARDRAEEAKVSAQASAAIATEKASEAISSATTASQSALTAESASESAQASADASYQNAQTAYRYAQDSATSAGQAGSKAQEASGYASSANTSAQTASQKALEASQSATNAQTYAINAESAKTASQTAQGLAESARDGAVTAKADAESARDEAQSIANGITGKVEQIDSNTERIESLEDDRYKPYAVDYASGAVASFADGADGIPLKSCIVQVEPVQEGSGDPSPDNVRPITGWTGVEVRRTGKNIINMSKPSYDGTGINKYYEEFTVNSGSIKRFTLIAGQTYTFSYDLHSSVYPCIASIGCGNGTYSRDIKTTEIFADGRVSITFTPTETDLTGRPYLAIRPVRYTQATTFDWSIDNIQLELGSTATAYKPYTGQTYPITFPSEAGIVYGAYVNVLNGELVVDRAQIASYNGETLPSTWISDRDVYASGTTPTIGAQVVYKLAEPIHYPLASTEIKTLLGTNNIWADTGDTEVEYRADVTKYINKKITEAVSALT